MTAVAYPSLRLRRAATNPFLPIEPTPESLDNFVAAVNSAGADILLLCMGAPKSELHASEAAERLRVAAVLCVGATVDFLGGTVRRAPKWVQRLGMEWAFRIVQEPRRLFFRYLAAGTTYVRTVITLGLDRPDLRPKLPSKT